VILLAVESGSRAWGFPSKDSDFDVRFVYCRHPEFYLSIELTDQADVIERPIEDSIDLSGWDIRKALLLFRKSNPPLLEWLQCPIIYTEKSSFANELRKFLPDFYSSTASFFHYKHMAEGNFRDYFTSYGLCLRPGGSAKVAGPFQLNLLVSYPQQFPTGHFVKLLIGSLKTSVRATNLIEAHGFRS
jgi:predicted nucleotidyltransferase